MNILFFLLGLFSTLQIFKYNLFGASIYPFDLIYYALIVVLFVNVIKNRAADPTNTSGKGKIILAVFIAYSIFSVNMFSPILDGVGNDYLLVTFKFFIKKLIFLVFFFLILYSRDDFKRKFINYFIMGFIISIFLHAIYSYFTSYFWYFQNIDIHSKWLNAIGITEASVQHGFRNFIYYPILRTTGFHWDPAYFGVWGVLGVFYIFLKPYNLKKKLFLILVIVVPWILTFSRSAVFGLLAVIVILIITMIYNRKPLKHIWNLKNVIIIIVLLHIIVLMMLATSITGKIDFKEVFRSRMEVDVHTQKHLQYPGMALKALTKDPLHFAIGYGNRNSGRAVVEDIIAIQDNYSPTRAFDIETDLVRIPLNTGFLGFSTYLLFLIIICVELIKKYYRSNNEINLFVVIAIITTFFAGFFYAYSDSVWIWMFYAIAVLLLLADSEKVDIKQ
ncbi:MAG: hypothetical protein DRI23_10810 [Candidatus Cloacimonadota bacterium]|nr:MAG: hypothetical protein DRI23_10810 [Candidatus Cloacimonadota bacterium]